MATVRKRENESIESMLHRFKRKVNDELILNELKKREYALTKSQKRRIKQKEAAQKRRRYERMQRKLGWRPLYEDDNKGGYLKGDQADV
jgi:ribosomal protein S21